MIGIFFSKRVHRDKGTAIPEGHANEAFADFKDQGRFRSVGVGGVDFLASLLACEGGREEGREEGRGYAAGKSWNHKHLCSRQLHLGPIDKGTDRNVSTYVGGGDGGRG